MEKGSTPVPTLFALFSGGWFQKCSRVPDCLSFTVDLIQAKHVGFLKMRIFSHGTFKILPVYATAEKRLMGLLVCHNFLRATVYTDMYAPRFWST